MSDTRNKQFFIIGAMKAGTSSLYSWLADHPSVFASPVKEPEYFAIQSPSPLERSTYFSLFDGRTDDQWAFEGSTAYTKFPRVAGIPERIFNVFPQARFIYVLRSPLDRIYSHYLDNWIERGDRDSFEDAVLHQDSHYVNVSRYYLQLRQYMDWFPMDQVHVVMFEELVRNPETVLIGICRFLEIDPGFTFKSLGVARNVTKAKRPNPPFAKWLTNSSWYRRIPAPIRRLGSTMLRPCISPKCPQLRDLKTPRRDQILTEFLRDDVENLRELLHLDTSKWIGKKGRDSECSYTPTAVEPR